MRYLPGRAFPPYAFLPGRDPHPTRDPHGHSFGAPEEPVQRRPPAEWRASAPYLFGADLYNHGFLWEAHEAWESLWHACGRKGPVATFLKGLIKLAAAGVKTRQGIPEGTRRHAARAAELWRSLGVERMMGLDVAELIGFAEGVAAKGEFEFVLHPV